MSPSFWVLHRVRIRFLRRPRWNEAVSLTTWPSGMERLYALRQFHIDSAEGERLVDVASAWIILDAVRRRPVRPEKHLPEDRIHDQELLTMPTGKTEAISLEETASLRRHVVWQPVRPSDTDRNRHVNNARYLQWLLDGAPETLAARLRRNRHLHGGDPQRTGVQRVPERGTHRCRGYGLVTPGQILQRRWRSAASTDGEETGRSYLSPVFSQPIMKAG
jgi:acyl-CoA thioesterase FadM